MPLHSQILSDQSLAAEQLHDARILDEACSRQLCNQARLVSTMAIPPTEAQPHSFKFPPWTEDCRPRPNDMLFSRM